MNIRIEGGRVGMLVDQWCEIIADDKHGMVVRSCGDPKVIWAIEPAWIIGIRLSLRTTISVKVTRINEES